MTNKFKHYIDWLSVKITSFIFFTVSVLEKYDHIISILTKYVGYMAVWIGTATVLIRFYKTWKDKGVNGD
jgi:hypothetical protein